MGVVAILIRLRRTIFFFLNDPAPTDTYPLPHPAALPISPPCARRTPTWPTESTMDKRRRDYNERRVQSRNAGAARPHAPRGRAAPVPRTTSSPAPSPA